MINFTDVGQFLSHRSLTLCCPAFRPQHSTVAFISFRPTRGYYHGSWLMGLIDSVHCTITRVRNTRTMGFLSDFGLLVHENSCHCTCVRSIGECTACYVFDLFHIPHKTLSTYGLCECEQKTHVENIARTICLDSRRSIGKMFFSFFLFAVVCVSFLPNRRNVVNVCEHELYN